MTRRPGAIALARAVNALFFLALSGYCFLAFTPFAYDAFIKPGVIHALWAFIAIASALYWVMLLMTVLTLLPQLSTPGARGRAAAWAYVAAGVVVGIVLVVRPPMEVVGNNPTAFALGMAALVSPVWLAMTIPSRIVVPTARSVSSRPSALMLRSQVDRCSRAGRPTSLS